MIQRKNKSFLKIFFYSSFFTIILFIFLILVSLNFVRTFRREREIRRRVFILEEEISSLEGQRINFLETIEYLKTDFFREKEAREKFGLKKFGEEVIVILPTEEEEKEEKNIKKWWDFLFRQN